MTAARKPGKGKGKPEHGPYLWVLESHIQGETGWMPSTIVELDRQEVRDRARRWNTTAPSTLRWRVTKYVRSVPPTRGKGKV